MLTRTSEIRSKSDRGRPALARADPAERDIHTDPVQPRRQSCVAAEPFEPAKRDHEHFLNEVFEVAAIAEHAVQVARDLAAEPVIELVLRGAFVGAATPDQVRFVDRVESGRRAGFALHPGQHSVRPPS